MTNYKSLWDARKKQLITINVIFAIFGIGNAISYGNIMTGLMTWFFGSWIIATLISTFGKTGDKVASVAKSMGASLFSGTFAAASGGSTLWVFYFIISMIKATVGAVFILAVLIYEFFAYPISSIYYFVRSR